MKTKISVVKDEEGHVVSFESAGHTGLDEHGKDILCAAISTLVQTAALGLNEVLGLSIQVAMRDGYFSCILPDDMDDTQKNQADIILNTMLVGLYNLQNAYPMNLEILDKED